MMVAIVPSEELDRLRELERLAMIAYGYRSFLEANEARLKIKQLLGLISKEEEISLRAYVAKKGHP